VGRNVPRTFRVQSVSLSNVTADSAVNVPCGDLEGQAGGDSLVEEVSSASRLSAPDDGFELQSVSPSKMSADTVEQDPRGNDLPDRACVDDLLVEEPSVAQRQYV
jgi:hypothetical protein